VDEERRAKATALRRTLARYRGGTFETDANGGAGGMIFFRDAAGDLYYIGGFNPADAHQIATALNLVLDLLERQDRLRSCTNPPREKTR
jgi:hypothetical protein